jgi:hypothetical protein
MSPGVRSLYRVGRWAAVDAGGATFVLPPQYRDRAEGKRSEVESALAAHFGTRLPVRLEVEPATRPANAPPDEAPLTAPPPDEEAVSAAEFAELAPAPDGMASVEARLMKTFPGTTEVTG